MLAYGATRFQVGLAKSAFFVTHKELTLYRSKPPPEASPTLPSSFSGIRGEFEIKNISLYSTARLLYMRLSKALVDAYMYLAETNALSDPKYLDKV